MTAKECIAYVEAHMEVKYATANGAYKAGRKISPVGCVNHSFGCAQPSVDVCWGRMNRAEAGWGVNAFLGDFHKGEGRIIVAMPLDARPWGVGSGKKGSYNNSHVQWEVMEPAGHTYAGGTMIAYDVQKNQAYFDRMWKMLVCWNVYMVKKFGYPVSAICDHAECHAAGYGSNHSDMGQWIPKHGKSMDALRQEVQAILDTPETPDVPEEGEDMRFNTVEDVEKGAGYALPTIEKMISKGFIAGGGAPKDKKGNPTDMDLSLDMLRILVMLDRAGSFGN